MRLAQDQAWFASIFVRQNKCCHLVCHMSHLCLLSHAPSSMSTSSSSATYLTTQREHSVHPAHLQDHSVDKLRHQESLWREDLQSGGNPRTTTPTRGYRCGEGLHHQACCDATVATKRGRRRLTTRVKRGLATTTVRVTKRNGRRTTEVWLHSS